LKTLSEIDFYLVTDAKLSKKGIISDVKNSVNAGCKIIQYREKNKSTKDMIDEAELIMKACEGKAVFLVDDKIDVALAVDADGVHIGQEDISIVAARELLGKDKIIGLTVHDEKEAIEAEKNGANYIGLAPIFETDTKKDAKKPCGVGMIERVRNEVHLPIVAIGGITKDNIKDVMRAGADSVVAIAPVVGSDNVYEEVTNFIKIIKENKLR
jgi:thiamine-phosphate pyrophosphorylase